MPNFFLKYVILFNIFPFLISVRIYGSTTKKIIREDFSIKYYRVQRGDTLFKISRKYDISITKIKRLNNISMAGRIRIGRKIILDKIFIKKSKWKNNSKGLAIKERIFSLERESVNFSSERKVKLVRSFKLGHKRFNPLNLYRCSKNYSIRSVAPGKIVRLGKIRGLGKYIVIHHNSSLETVYTGIKDIRVVGYSQVKAGDTLGNCSGGNAGFMVLKNGQAVNPKLYF